MICVYGVTCHPFVQIISKYIACILWNYLKNETTQNEYQNNVNFVIIILMDTVKKNNTNIQLKQTIY